MARAKRERVAINRLGTAMHDVLKQLAMRNAEVVATAVVREWPLAFRKEALAFYPSVLGVVSTNLKRSMRGFSERKSGTVVATGLRDKMEYARYLEFGTEDDKGNVRIKPRLFLSTPLRTAANRKIEELMKDIGF